MKKLLKKCLRSAVCLSLAAACYCWVQQPMCSAAALEPSITMSLADFQKLEQNSAELEKALIESATALNEAKKLLTASDEDLTELQASLTTSRQKIAALQAELKAQKEASLKLSAALTQQVNDCETLKAQLSVVEKSLNATEQAYQKEHKSMERQKRLWQVIAIVAAGIAATR